MEDEYMNEACEIISRIENGDSFSEALIHVFEESFYVGCITDMSCIDVIQADFEYSKE